MNQEIEFEELYFGETVEVIIPFAPNRWQRFGGKIKVKEGQKMEELLDAALGKIEAWHRGKYPELYADAPALKKEIEKPPLTPEETASWNSLVKMLTRLGNKEDALRYLSESKEWKLSVEAKQIANSLPDKRYPIKK